MQKILAVDIGTSFITIGDGDALVQRQPNVGRFIVKNGKLNLLSIGYAALKTRSMEDGSELIRPYEDGVIMNVEAQALIIKQLLSTIAKKSLFDPYRVYASISSSLTPLEKDETEKAIVKAGFDDIKLVESVLTLLPFVDPEGSAVAILGGGSFEAGVITNDGIVSACSVNISGETLNKKIIDRIYEQYKLKISTLTAETVKMQIGSLYERDLSRLEISGRDIIDGKIKNVEINADQLRPVIAYCYQKMVDVVNSLLTTIPATYHAGIIKNGLLLAGGGAEMRGVEDFFAKRLGFAAKKIEEPALAVARGLQQIAQHSDKYNI